MAPPMSSQHAQEMAVAHGAAASDSRRWKTLHNHYSLDFPRQQWYQINAQTGKPMGPMPWGDAMKENIVTNAHFYLHTTKGQAEKFSAENLINDMQSMQHPQFCNKYRYFPQMMAGRMYSAGISPLLAEQQQMQQKQMQRASAENYSLHSHCE